MEKRKFLSSLGLCRRAGKLQVGTEAVLLALRKGRAAFVFLASDVSDNTRKKLTSSCAYYKTPLKEACHTMSELSDALGTTYNVAAVAVEKGEIAHLF